MRRVIAAITGAGVIITVILALTGGLAGLAPAHGPLVPDGPAPWDFTIPEWDQALGGDAELTTDSYRELDRYQDPSLEGQVAEVRALATQVTLADLTGDGQEALKSGAPDSTTPYWPDKAATGVAPSRQCTDVTFLAASPAALPVVAPDHTRVFDQYAKVLVAFTGTCGQDTYTQQQPGVRYVYAGKDHGAWFALRYWQVPALAGYDTIPGATEPYDWELKQVGGACVTTTVVRARIAVVDALELMCAQAEAEGHPLTVVSGYRTRAEQQHLFRSAITYYGSEADARKYVAYADNHVCTSRHCSGLAINIEPEPATLTWLSQTVGCVTTEGSVSESPQCAATETPVPNAARWGFASTISQGTGYLEFTLPMLADPNSSLATPNCNPVGLPVANQIAAVFRCRLARDGIVGPQQDTVVAQALAVAHCESGWNPTAAAFGGRYATVPNPADGRLYTQRGVFMLTENQAEDGWVVGGPDALTDAVANINAAASLWLSTRGWEQFGCATGTSGGFEGGPVLEQYGGPPLPPWATAY